MQIPQREYIQSDEFQQIRRMESEKKGQEKESKYQNEQY